QLRETHASDTRAAHAARTHQPGRNAVLGTHADLRGRDIALWRARTGHADGRDRRRRVDGRIVIGIAQRSEGTGHVGFPRVAGVWIHPDGLRLLAALLAVHRHPDLPGIHHDDADDRVKYSH